MARQRHNAAFVVGSILGGVAGAAAALWKTPRSGPELRAQISQRLGGIAGSAGSSASMAASKVSKVRVPWNTTTSPGTRSYGSGSGMGGRVLSFVEHATAPIVGVKLGQTANRAGSEHVSGVHSGSRVTTTPTGDPLVAPRESTGETREAGVGHVASTEELVTPMVPVETQSTTEATGPLTEFPKFDADNTRR